MELHARWRCKWAQLVLVVWHNRLKYHLFKKLQRGDADEHNYETGKMTDKRAWTMSNYAELRKLLWPTPILFENKCAVDHCFPYKYSSWCLKVNTEKNDIVSGKAHYMIKLSDVLSLTEPTADSVTSYLLALYMMFLLLVHWVSFTGILFLILDSTLISCCQWVWH